MTEKFDYSLIDKILEAHESSSTAVIAILQDIQEHYHYLPREVFPYIAEKLGMSEARIYSVATFYENFSLEPKGKYVIRICRRNRLSRARLDSYSGSYAQRAEPYGGEKDDG